MMYRFVFLLLCLFFAFDASALCEQGPINVVTRIKKGTPVYNNSYSRAEFSKLVGADLNPNTVGVTHTKLNYIVKLSSKTQKRGKDVCAVLTKVIFEFGYDKIPVYIDKKHKPSSCPYKVTKKHEDYHVAVSQQAMKFFEQDIKKKLRQILHTVKSQPARSPAELQVWVDAQQQKVFTEMAPIIQHIQSKIDEKNAAIDTPESYRQTTALCPKHQW